LKQSKRCADDLRPWRSSGVVDGDDAALPRAVVKARDPVRVDVEVLADQLAQQVVRLVNCFVSQEAIGPLDGEQAALGVLRDARQHPLALSVLAPAAVRLLIRPCVVELERDVEDVPRRQRQPP
jgi:hypothetical protein